MVATHNRADRLARLLDSLAAQTLAPDRFEVLVVDDGSDDDTPQLLARRAADGGLALRVVRREPAAGPATARDSGWRETSAPLVVFTDDDCRAEPGWLEALRDAAAAHPGTVVMGRTDPDPDEAHLRSPFSRTLVVHQAGPPYETCNILYPRQLLERLDGFDTSYPRPGGEDTDLGWRADRAGAPAVFAERAQVYHAVLTPGPLGNLRHALRWETTVPVFKRHPDLRRRQLHRGIFWSETHEHLLRFLLACALGRRWRLLRLWLAAPYLRRLVWRRSGPILAPYILLYDSVELAAIVRGAVRERVLVL